MNTCKIGSRRGFIPLFLALALTLLLFPTTASAKDMVDVTQEVTLRVGEAVTLTNPASAKGMAISAYSWRLEGGDVVSEDNTANSATASVTALQPGRAIVIGYLDGCYAQTKQISSNYDDETRTWDKFHYTTYSENYTYTYRFHITVLNPDGSEPSGATIAELTAQMEAEDKAAADEIANAGSGTCGANVRWVFDHGTLIISGTGAMKDYGEYEILGKTRDDAAGEAFDKVARAIGLGYPGGPKIDQLSKEGNPEAISFPRAKVTDAVYDFSFSGLKSAVLNYLNSCEMKGIEVNRADVAASFQKAVIDVLVEHAMEAVKEYGFTKFAIAGGVASNSGLREAFEKACEKRKIDFYHPSPIFCTDNAAMIGVAGYYEYLKGSRSGYDLNAVPNLRLGER